MDPVALTLYKQANCLGFIFSKLTTIEALGALGLMHC